MGQATDQYSDRKKAGGYPLGLNKIQFESLLAGVAAAVVASGPVQDKIVDMIPSFMNDTGRVSGSGLAVTVLIVAILFYILKQFVVKSH
jgi:hypothetical protein